MMIFERELGLMDQQGVIEGFTAIERQDDAKKPWFELSVNMSETDDSYTITTARQSPRKWVHMNSLIEYLRVQCPAYVQNHFNANKPALEVIFGVTTTSKTKE